MRFTPGENGVYRLECDSEAPDDVIIYIERDGLSQTITLDKLLPYWDYAVAEEIESVDACVIGDYIAGIVTVASRQGGIVFLWDMNEEEIIHVSDGSYTIAVAIDEDSVYSLCLIENYSTPAHFAAYKSPLGIFDAFNNPEPLNLIVPIPLDVSQKALYGSELCVSDGGMAILMDGKLYYQQTL